MAMKGSVFWGLLLVVSQLSAQTAFDSTYGDVNCYAEGFSLLETPTGYVVSTAELCPPSINWTGQLTTLNPSGDSLSANTLPVNGYLLPTTDNHLLWLGGTRAGLNYDTIRLAKTNWQGDTVWTYDLFLPLCNNQVYSAVNTNDGGYAFTGIYSVDSCNAPASFNSWVLKLNANGQLQWLKTFGGADDDQLHVIRQHADGTLALFGWSNSYGTGDIDLWMLKLAANGDSLQSVTWGEPGVNDFGYGMDIAPRGRGYIINYYSDSIRAQLIDNQYNITWERAIGIPSGGRYHSAQTTEDERFVFLSCFDSPTGCESHLVKLDTYGTLLWDKTWGGLLRTVVEASPGAFLLAGYKGSFPALPQVHVVRFDTTVLPVDTTTATPDFTTKPQPATLYPNPASREVTILYSGSIMQVNCYNAVGARVELHDKTIREAGPGRLTLDISEWPAGLYLITLEVDGQTQNIKLVKY